MNLSEPAGWLGASYADELAAVGLHPDNPDQMYAQLTSFLRNPKAFKEADKNWRGARDNLSWWEEPKGVARLIWPFHGGKWLTEGPKNEAQIRAVFKIPAGKGTKQGLSELYKFPFRSDLSYNLVREEWKQDGGGINIDVGGAVNTLANVVSTVAPGLLPGSSALAALVTGKDPIAALKKDIDNFAQDASLAKAVTSGDWGGAGNIITDKAAKLGIQLPPAAVQAAVAVAKAGGDPKTIATTALGDGYKAAWNAATNYGQILTDLQPPAGLSYKPGAAPLPSGAPHPTTAQVEAHPATAPARKVISLKLGPAAPPAAAAAPSPAPAAPAAPSPSPPASSASSTYGPYPKR